MIIFFFKLLININIKCCIPFDYTLVLSCNLRNHDITLVALHKDHLVTIYYLKHSTVESKTKYLYLLPF